MLSPEQQALLDRAKESLQSQEASGERLPCFGFHLAKNGNVHEHSRSCAPGDEEQLFSWVIEQLQVGADEGAICTALLVPLQRANDDVEGGVMLDLQQRAGSRLVGVLPWLIESGRLAFGEPTLTARPAALFRAA